MKFYLDTEFYEDFTKPWFGKSRHFIDLISIALVSEKGDDYYAISKDFDLKAAWNKYDLSEANTAKNHSQNDKRIYWLRNNVLKPIYEELIKETYRDYIPFTYRIMKSLLKEYGKTNKQIAQEIQDFIYESGNNVSSITVGKKRTTYQFDNDLQFYAYYSDYDWVVFCSLFGKMIDLPDGWPMYCRDLKQMLDEKSMSFMPLQDLKKLKDYPKEDNSHNALNDAKFNKKLHEFLNKL